MKRKTSISTSSVVLGTAGGVVVALAFHFPAAAEALRQDQPVTLVPAYLILGAIGGAIWGLSNSVRTRRWGGAAADRQPER